MFSKRVKFRLFPQCFQKTCFAGLQKVSLCWNGLRVNSKHTDTEFKKRFFADHVDLDLSPQKMQSDCGSTLSNRSSNDTGLKPGEFYIFNNDLVIGTYLQIWSNKDEKETKALQF